MPPSLVADSHAIATKKLAASRSWVLLNARGQSVVLDVDKYAIMRRVGIHARDLRILDPLLSYPSAILGRERAIVLNLEHIKAIITAEEVFLRNPTDENVIPVVEELCRRLPMSHDEHGLGLVSNKSTEHKAIDPTRLRALSKSRSVGNRSAEHKAIELSRLRSLSKSRHAASKDQEEESSFEFRALEVALEAICSFLDARTMELEAAAYPALDELTSKISSRNLDRVRKLKAGMTRLTARVQKVRDELEQLLDDDGDMAELFLTRKQASSTSPAGGSLASNIMLASLTIGSRISRASAGTYGTENDVEELEMLLEAYFMQIDGTLNKLITLREYIDDTEDYINIQLDNHRNQLIQLELVLSAATVVMAIYSSVAGVFGMNLPYPWNVGHDYLFKWVVLVVGLVCLSLFSAIMFYARYKGLIGS